MQPLVGQSIRLQRFQSQIYIFLGGGGGISIDFLPLRPQIKMKLNEKKV